MTAFKVLDPGGQDRQIQINDKGSELSGSNSLWLGTDDTLNISGSVIVNSGITGSLTQLSNGNSYIEAGTNVTVTTGSTGNITIAAAAASLPTPTMVGEVLFAVTANKFVQSLPITSYQGWLVNNQGYMLVSASL